MCERLLLGGGILYVQVSVYATGAVKQASLLFRDEELALDQGILVDYADASASDLNGS